MECIEHTSQMGSQQIAKCIQHQFKLVILFMPEQFHKDCMKVKTVSIEHTSQMGSQQKHQYTIQSKKSVKLTMSQQTITDCTLVVMA